VEVAGTPLAPAPRDAQHWGEDSTLTVTSVSKRQ
jgi:hypothetical protein